MRWMFWASASVLVAVTVLALASNGGEKYVRIRAEDGCVASFANVYGSGVSSMVCCTRSENDHGVCPKSRFSSMTKVFTSGWAFVIPLAGFLVNVACQHLAGVGVAAHNRQSHMNRLLLYIGVILARAGGLYLAMNVIQDQIQQPESRLCWYASLRRSGTCSEHFDFADHVVLAACQYFAIQVFEMYCATMEFRESLVVSTPRTLGGTGLPWLALAIPLCVCLLISGCSLVLVFETAVFFHTRLETVAALVISWVFVGRHLQLLMGATGSGGDSGNSSSREEERNVGVAMNTLQSPSRGIFLRPLPREVILESEQSLLPNGRRD